LIKLPLIKTVYPIINRNLPQGTEIWPPGSRDINPFDYLKCGTITTIMEVFSNIPREDLKRACSHFLSRLEEVIECKVQI
jgi:hypothetical protein